MKPALIGASLFAVALLQSAPAAAQDMAAMQKWEKVEIVHYEVVGEFTRKHVQIPPTDADLYADVFERVTLSFDWNKKKGVIVGTPTIKNDAARVSNLMGMDKKCPTGKLNGPYEHFDVVEIRQAKPREALELVGKRIHPDTMVADSCNSKLRLFKGATVAAKEYIGPPDPQALAMAGMIPKDGPITVTPDGKSIVMKALNNNWIWTYTPTTK
ncbi:MAG: hypothetical protein KF853_02945 [Rhodocyclaceae bacterium]|nr:hypothetical protein [Rhodocyclaceae bacterium]